MLNKSQVKLVRYIVLCAVVILMVPLRGFAWGDVGHRAVARIASRYLTPQARARVVELLKADIQLNRNYYVETCPDVMALGEKAVLSDSEAATFTETGLACIASWPDPPLKDQRLYTSNWHFVDIPVNMHGPNGPILTSYEVARDCRMDDNRGDCAILALKRLRPVLANQTELAGSRAEALKFIVHIIGDLHQPMHCVTDKNNVNDVADLGDLGGNFKKVQFNVPAWQGNTNKDQNPRWHKQWNLHSVWDEGLIDAYMGIQNLTVDSYVAQLLNSLSAKTPEQFTKLQSGDLLTWIEESYSLAVKKGYKLPPKDTNYNGYILQSSYYESNQPITSEQLQTGGVRLARFLNETLAG